MMRTVFYAHKKEIRDLKERARLTEAAAKEAEEHWVTEVGSLSTQLQVMESRTAAPKERAWAVEE